MLSLTVFDRDENCTEKIKVKFAHMSMFNDSKIELHFIHDEEQMNLIRVLINSRVKFECNGQVILLDTKLTQKLRYRFDAISS